jgi:hypothetical protein
MTSADLKAISHAQYEQTLFFLDAMNSDARRDKSGERDAIYHVSKWSTLIVASPFYLCSKAFDQKHNI